MYKNEKSIRQLRKEAGLTRKEVFERYGIPRTSLYNWEKGISRCPDYVEAFLKEKLQDEIRCIIIRKESRQKSGKNLFLTGYGFYTGKDELYDFFPIEDENVSVSMIEKIIQLQTDGWKIIFENT